MIVGENSIVGANSIVTKDIPDNSMAIGNPAKVVKKVNELKCFKGFLKYLMSGRNQIDALIKSIIFLDMPYFHFLNDIKY